MFCVYCGKELAQGASHCNSCGKTLEKRLLVCQSCGVHNLDGDRYCIRCGRESTISVVSPNTIRILDIGKRAENRVKEILVETDGRLNGKTGREPRVHALKKEKQKSRNRRDLLLENPFRSDVQPPKNEARQHTPLPPGETTIKPLGIKIALLAAALFVCVALVFAYIFQEGLRDFLGRDDAPIVAEEPYYEQELHEPYEPATPPEEPTPMPEPTPEPVLFHELVWHSTVAAGSGHFHLIDINGGLWSWGMNEYGQLGSGDDENREIPVWVMGNAIKVVAGDNHTLVVTEDGSLWGFGLNENFQLGTGDMSNRFAPTWILGGVVFAYADGNSSHAITGDGNLWRWGEDEGQDIPSPMWVLDYGIRYVNESEDFLLESRMDIDLGILDIVANDDFMLVLCTDGSLFIGQAAESIGEGWQADFVEIFLHVMAPWQNVVRLY